MLIVLSTVIWFKLNTISGGALEKRYQIDIRGEKGGSFTARDDILKADYKIFLDNKLYGVGVGMSKLVRLDYGYSTRAGAHTEFSRLLAEHGMFGVLALLILILISFAFYVEQFNNKEIVVFFVLFTLALLTMAHSAMRLALPGFIFGLGYINFIGGGEGNKIKKQQLLNN